MKVPAMLEAASRVAEEAEALVLETRAESAILSGGRGVSIRHSEETSISIRLIRNGRIGLGTSTGSAGTHEAVDQAIASSRSGPAAPYHFPGSMEPQLLEIVHPQVDSMVVEDLAGLLLGVEDEMRSLWPRSTVRGRISRRTAEVALQNTSGFDGAYRKAVLDVSLSFAIAGSDGLTVRDSRFSTGLPVLDPARLVEGLMPCPPERKSMPAPRGECKAILSPRVFSTLLQVVRSQAGGWTQAHGFSGLEAGRRVGSACLDLHDRPRLPFGGASAPFDAEGVPTADRCLVREGLFEDHIHDLASAAACGTKSTGSAGRNPGGMTRPVCTNLVSGTGSKSLEGLMAEAAGGLFIAELLPGGTGDAFGGDLRIPFASAFVLGAGFVDSPLKSGYGLAGNAFDLLGRIVALEDTLYGIETDRLPHVLIEALPLS
jgi:PmbA protein